MSKNSFGAAADLAVGDKTYGIFRLRTLGEKVERLPFSIKVLLENLLRYEDGSTVTTSDIEALLSWSGSASDEFELAFRPARVLMQDFTGVPAVVDLAAMRDVMAALTGESSSVTPLIPVELVVDHSVTAQYSGTQDAFVRNAQLESVQNRERYSLLRWAQNSFASMSVVPPDTGICHQVNLEYLARGVFVNESGEAYPDTVVGTDSHTTMINGLGVLGWGVGGIEAEAALLGQPISMLVPSVVGVRLVGELKPGTTATDLVLTIAQLLRSAGVVGQFVEFYGDGVGAVPLETRATIGNMSPEYGSTCAIFPIDEETLRYLRFTGRAEEQVQLVEAYAKEQGLFHDSDSPIAHYSRSVELDLSSVVPSIAGPTRPQDRVSLADAALATTQAITQAAAQGSEAQNPANVEASERQASNTTELGGGSVVLAAITSCTNTSNPQVMVAAGLLARNAVRLGLKPKPWVKASLAPGSKTVTAYLDAAGLSQPLDELGFNLVGYGCTTCIGNSGPLLEGVSEEISSRGLAVSAVLSGNRNFEGRIHRDVRLNWLASPPLVVAYALAGSTAIDLTREPLGVSNEGSDVYLADLWPSEEEVAGVIRQAVRSEMFSNAYGEVYRGDEDWQELQVPPGEQFDWDDSSTYVKRSPFLEGLGPELPALAEIKDARVLVMLGDSVTTDHISPAGSIAGSSPAGKYLAEHGVSLEDFSSYGARRGNHEVMVRGTFANPRLKNALGGGKEGGVTTFLPDDALHSIYDAAMLYAKRNIALIVLAGKDYGAGSSRDWAAKGPLLLGVRAVIAESFERIHRSNLVGMGILPLQFVDGENAAQLGLDGRETFTVQGLEVTDEGTLSSHVTVLAGHVSFRARVRIDTPQEAAYFRNGGILPYVTRQLLQR